jgi:hypothetical protein
MVASMRMNVDLPAPFGPSKPRIPGLISREKFFNPQKSRRYCLPRFVTLSFIEYSPRRGWFDCSTLFTERVMIGFSVRLATENTDLRPA